MGKDTVSRTLTREPQYRLDGVLTVGAIDPGGAQDHMRGDRLAQIGRAHV